jgi:hypothetical protein
MTKKTTTIEALIAKAQSTARPACGYVPGETVTYWTRNRPSNVDGYVCHVRAQPRLHPSLSGSTLPVLHFGRWHRLNETKQGEAQ